MNMLLNKESPTLTPFIKRFYLKSIILIKNELKKNWISFLFPLPILIICWAISSSNGRPFELNFSGTSIYLTGLFFIALVYGLQCFSGEADRKTLDFLLTKPVTPASLLSVKYFISLIILVSWLFLSKMLFIINLEKLGLPKEVSFEWVLLIFIMVHAMSCFSGLLVKGLERLFAILIITSGVAGMSYYLWWRFFNLMQANYYLPDTPPHLNMFVLNVLPIFFSIMGISLPFIGTLWLMKNRIKLWRFKPALWSVGIWIFAYLILLLSENIFSPVLWPDKTAKFGDWHEKAGIILAGPSNPSQEFVNPSAFEKQRMLWNLSLSIPGHRSKVIYRGYNLYKPKFSPDGGKIVFSEEKVLKILDLHSRTIERIGPGLVAGWSNNGQQLVCAQEIGKQSLSKLFIFDRINKTKRYIPGTLNAVDLVWDSRHNNVFVFEYKTGLKLLNLNNLRKTAIEFEDSKLYPFGIFLPSTALYEPLDRLFFSQNLGRRILYYYINLETNKITIDEEKMDFRIKSGAPILICNTPTYLLWPRIDGGFVFQTTNLNIGIHHHHSKNDHDE